MQRPALLELARRRRRRSRRRRPRVVGLVALGPVRHLRERFPAKRPPRHRADASMAPRTTREFRGGRPTSPTPAPSAGSTASTRLAHGESESALTIFTGAGRRRTGGSFSTVAIVLSSSSGCGEARGGRIRDEGGGDGSPRRFYLKVGSCGNCTGRRRSQRSPRHRRAACSMTWRQFLAARRGQTAASAPRNDLGKNRRAHPTTLVGFPHRSELANVTSFLV